MRKFFLQHASMGMRFFYDERYANSPNLYLMDDKGETLSDPGKAKEVYDRIQKGFNPKPIDFKTLTATEVRERVEALGLKYANFSRGVKILERAQAKQEATPNA